MFVSLVRSLLASCVLACLAAPASGQTFSFLQAPFTQELYAASPGFMGNPAFAPNGDVWVTPCASAGGGLRRFDASTTVQEVDDEEARRLVADWRGRFDAIPKGWKKGNESGLGITAGPPGYPEPAWSELRTAADAAHDRLGVLLRDLMKAG